MTSTQPRKNILSFLAPADTDKDYEGVDFAGNDTYESNEKEHRLRSSPASQTTFRHSSQTVGSVANKNSSMQTAPFPQDRSMGDVARQHRTDNPSPSIFRDEAAVDLSPSRNPPPRISELVSSQFDTFDVPSDASLDAVDMSLVYESFRHSPGGSDVLTPTSPVASFEWLPDRGAGGDGNAVLSRSTHHHHHRQRHLRSNDDSGYHGDVEDVTYQMDDFVLFDFVGISARASWGETDWNESTPSNRKHTGGVLVACPPVVLPSGAVLSSSPIKSGRRRKHDRENVLALDRHSNDFRSHKHWNQEEDEILKSAIASEMFNLPRNTVNWEQISNICFQCSRSSKQCRQRWNQHLRPGVGDWQPHEDNLIVSLVSDGAEWSAIALKLPGRCEKAISHRYRNFLDPTLKPGSPWTSGEDETLLGLVSRHEKKWARYTEFLPGRSENTIKNRYYTLQKRKEKQKIAAAAVLANLSDEDISNAPASVNALEGLKS